MNISGQRRLSVPAEKVWVALHDVDVLKDSVPGCRQLEQTDARTFQGSASVGIAVIKGLYTGSVRLLEEQEESLIRIAVQARSGHAEIRGEGQIELEPDDGATIVRYRGDASISGPLAAVGQRLLPSASKSMTEQFFQNLERRLMEADRPDS